MSKLHTLFAISVAVAMLAACAEPPTASLPMPDEARLDEGGMGFGSGHLDGGSGFGSGNVTTTSTTTVDPGAGTEEPTESRGGFMIGTGH